MSRIVAVLAALACILGFTVAPAPPAAADTVTVGESGWSVALAFPDLQWTSTNCQFLPVKATVTGAGVESWTFGGFVTDAEGDESETHWYIDYDTKVTAGAGSFTFRHAVMLCPGYDGTGPYVVTGEVGVHLTGAAEWSWLPYSATFSTVGIPTTTVLDSVAVAGGEAFFTGRTSIAAPSPVTFRGCGEDGVTIQVQQETEWVEIAWGALHDDGTFSVTATTNQLSGTQYRARFSGAICAASVSEARTLSVKVPKVSLSTNSKQSKLRVDIDPNVGRRSWTFQVQRQADEDWKTVRTYRTQGSRETRTINLGKGYYRILVKAQRGFVETYSDSVWLER